MKLLGRISAKRFSATPLKKIHRKTLIQKAKRARSSFRLLYNLSPIEKSSSFFNVFVLPPKKITRSGNPKYMYRYPYQRNRSFERMKHGNIPTVADKRICFKFFVLKFLSIVFITLHHFLRENSFMISQQPLLYKEKLL